MDVTTDQEGHTMRGDDQQQAVVNPLAGWQQRGRQDEGQRAQDFNTWVEPVNQA